MNSVITASRSTAAPRDQQPVLPTGVFGRTRRLLGLPVRHAARTVAAASRLSGATTEQIATRSAEQVFATLGELKGGAAKLGQAMSVFEAALPDSIAGPYRSTLSCLADATPAMPATVARRVLESGDRRVGYLGRVARRAY
jgi:predicted unusual protein kinase regulating ubiquinone biosynthesis (AarF/ABC1/UbiB family)